MAGNKTIVTIVFISLVSLLAAGCSDDSNPVATTQQAVVDTAPPAVPSNLSVNFQADSATVTWDANTVDADFAGFLLEKVNYDNSYVLIGAPAAATSFQDTEILSGITTYMVTAVDEAGNESAYASVQIDNSGFRVDENMQY